MITQEQFEEFLARNHEIPGVEFKGPGPRSDEYLRAKVLRAVMGMTNRRDGGIVIIGVDERSSTLNPVGLSPNELESWRNIDHVGNDLVNYMSPPPAFDLSIFEYQGRAFAVLEVIEFTDVPTICKKRYYREHQSGHREFVLREGACYVRSRHKPETVEVSSLEQMRELLDLATEKGVRKFVTQAQRAGMSLISSNQPSDQELFEQQFEGWSSSLIEKIQTRGFWKIIIRPDNFAQERVAYDALFPLVQRCAVDLRGDGFPNAVSELPIIRGADCVGQQIEAGHILEAWNIYQSGQFIYFSGMVDDWLDQSDWPQLREGWQLGNKLAIEEVIRLYTGIYVFASRLSLTEVYAQETHININVLIKGLRGRHLYISAPRRVPLRWAYESQIPDFPYKKRLQKDELIANAKELALRASHNLFLRFGWNAAQAILESTQSNYYTSS